MVSSLSGATSVPTTTGVSIISFPDRHLLSLGADPISSSGNIDPMLRLDGQLKKILQYGNQQ